MDNEQNLGSAVMPAGNATSANSSAPDVSPSPGETGSGWSHDNLTKAAQWAVEGGTCTREQANEMLKNDGVAPLPEPKQYPTVEAEEIDKAFPGAKITDYDMPRFVEHGQEITPAVQKFDLQFRGWLSTGQFPREIGNYVAAEVNRTGHATKRMTEIEQKAWVSQQRQLLQQTFGDKLPERMELARQLVHELEQKSPGIKAMLEVSRAAENAMVVAQFAAQAERLFIKKGRK